MTTRLAESPKEGLYQISAAQYYRDPCDPPSLSASIAAIICSQSPLHAWTAHPRLNPDFRREAEERFDIGSAAHALYLEGEAAVEIIEAPDWRTVAARSARDEARAAGKIPLLAHTLADVEAMVEAASRQLSQHEASPPLFTAGRPEQTILWEEGGVMCRARLDWLHDDYSAVDDYKTTSRSANPEAWSRALFSMGAEIQAAFYARGVYAVTGCVPEFRWAVQETYPPYALSVIAPGPGVLELANRKVEYAIDLWRKCMETGEWPAYPQRICWANLPGYEESKWLEREER